MSMVFGYQPPVGFGNDVNDPTKKKAQPGDPGYIDSGIGASGGGTGGADALPGLGNVATYTRQLADPTQGGGIDLSQPFQLAPGARDRQLMADSGYATLLDQLGLDEKTAGIVAFGATAAQNSQVSALNDLARQSQEDRYGIDAVLRSRGVGGQSSQREALQARALANEGKSAENIRGQTADRIAGLNQQLADTISQLKRAQATGAGDAAGRLQAQADALQAQIAQQQAADTQAAASK
jgi:hypothetical protein